MNIHVRPSELARASQYANLASIMRAKIRKRGTTCNGHPLWTETEDEICRKLHPDFAAMERALPRRTRQGVIYRCRVLKLNQAAARPWTGQEQTRLRRLYRTCAVSELLEIFPDRSLDSIAHRANAMGVFRAKKPYKATKEPLLDELRAECFRQKITMPDLDVVADAKGYFRRRAWRGPHGTIDMRRIVKAIRELGGEVRVEWSDM